MDNDRVQYTDDTPAMLSAMLNKVLFENLPPERRRFIMQICAALDRGARRGIIFDKTDFGLLEYMYFKKYPDGDI